MSYGVNQPWGLQAIKTINGSTWNGQTSTYFISSGYTNNIFKGDLVFVGPDGFIGNLSDSPAGGGVGALGVSPLSVSLMDVLLPQQRHIIPLTLQVQVVLIGRRYSHIQ